MRMPGTIDALWESVEEGPLAGYLWLLYALSWWLSAIDARSLALPPHVIVQVRAGACRCMPVQPPKVGYGLSTASAPSGWDLVGKVGKVGTSIQLHSCRGERGSILHCRIAESQILVLADACKANE